MSLYHLLPCVLLCLPSCVGEEHNCSYIQNYKMTGATCTSQQLHSVPVLANTNIQILDLSSNLLEELHGDSFKSYTLLKYLFLKDNLIFHVENGTFDIMQDLEVVDLSKNLLKTVPSGVLQLPKLRKLYMDDNPLDGKNYGGFEDAPIRDTLHILSLANCHLQEMPQLDMYPKLRKLNLSGNAIKKISPWQLFSMCLELLDLRNNSALFKNSDGCECYVLSEWVQQNNIYLVEEPLNCSPNGNGAPVNISFCLKMSSTTQNPMLQLTCRENTSMEAKKKNIWVLWVLPSIIVAAFVYIVILIIFAKVQNRKSTKRREIYY